MAKEKLCKEAFTAGHPNYKGTVLWGTSNTNLHMAYEHLKKGKEFVFIDMPYFDQTRIHFTDNIKKSYFRVTFNFPQLNKIYSVPEDRFNKLGVTIKPWRKTGSKILILGSSRGTNSFYGGGLWMNKIKQKVTSQTNKYIVCREKLSSKWVVAAKPLEDELVSCFATVSLISIASVKSVLEGVPTFCHPDSCCAPIAQTFKDTRLNLEKPYRPGGRLKWAQSLAYGQFTLEEMAKGLPFIHHKEYFS